jgi:hypothetical protein
MQQQHSSRGTASSALQECLSIISSSASAIGGNILTYRRDADTPAPFGAVLLAAVAAGELELATAVCELLENSPRWSTPCKASTIAACEALMLLCAAPQQAAGGANAGPGAGTAAGAAGQCSAVLACRQVLKQLLLKLIAMAHDEAPAVMASTGLFELLSSRLASLAQAQAQAAAAAQAALSAGSSSDAPAGGDGSCWVADELSSVCAVLYELRHVAGQRLQQQEGFLPSLEASLQVGRCLLTSFAAASSDWWTSQATKALVTHCTCCAAAR